MSARPQDNGHPVIPTPQFDQLECPRCRQPSDVPPGRGAAPRCPNCGMPLLRSARSSEVDAWRQLYGRPPPRLR